MGGLVINLIRARYSARFGFDLPRARHRRSFVVDIARARHRRSFVVQIARGHLRELIRPQRFQAEPARPQRGFGIHREPRFGVALDVVVVVADIFRVFFFEFGLPLAFGNTREPRRVDWRVLQHGCVRVRSRFQRPLGRIVGVPVQTLGRHLWFRLCHVRVFLFRNRRESPLRERVATRERRAFVFVDGGRAPGRRIGLRPFAFLGGVLLAKQRFSPQRSAASRRARLRHGRDDSESEVNAALGPKVIVLLLVLFVLFVQATRERGFERLDVVKALVCGFVVPYERRVGIILRGVNFSRTVRTSKRA